MNGRINGVPRTPILQIWGCNATCEYISQIILLDTLYFLVLENKVSLTSFLFFSSLQERDSLLFFLLFIFKIRARGALYPFNNFIKFIHS